MAIFTARMSMCARERKAKRNGTFGETFGRGTPAKLLPSTSWKKDKVAGKYYGSLKVSEFDRGVSIPVVHALVRRG